MKIGNLDFKFQIQISNFKNHIYVYRCVRAGIGVCRRVPGRSGARAGACVRVCAVKHI
jgi:hypothetical protein